MEKSKVLITGITGLIGKHIAQKILNENLFDIRGHCFSAKDISFFEQNNIEIFRADICKKEQLVDICSGCSIVVHSAARVIDFGTKAQFYEAHVDATKYILDEAIKSGVKHFIYISSFGPATYISRKNGVLPNEDIPLVKSGVHYDDAKIVAEEMVKSYAQKHGFDYSIIRPAAVVGPESVWVREPLLRIKKSALGVALIDNGKWDACLIDAANLADGIYRTITMPVARNQTYFLMDDWGITWKQYLTDLLSLVGKVPTLSLPKSIVLPLAKVLDKLLVPFGKKPPFSPKSILATGSDRRVDTTKARKELGWKSAIGYKDSFAKIKNWVQSQPDLLP